jgi:hypothetical protein
MSALFEQRRAKTEVTLEKFRERLTGHLGADFSDVIGDHTTVYVTGSGGRGEMSDASDLDLFIVRRTGKPSKIHAAILQAAIIRATRESGIEAPSADGVFLEMHSADDFAEMLGNAQDDAQNKFTARMLLMLESRPVLGAAAYAQIVTRMIDCYWSTAGEHEQDYLPFAFVNDAVRYWRVVLLNHEARLRTKAAELASEVEDAEVRKRRMKTERYIRSVKLRFARALTCFASLAYLLAISAREGHVTREGMEAMVKLTPLQRLHAAVEVAGNTNATPILERLDALYSDFLVETAYSKNELRKAFEDPEHASDLAHKGSDFGNAMFELLTLLGSADGKYLPLYRYMLV